MRDAGQARTSWGHEAQMERTWGALTWQLLRRCPHRLGRPPVGQESAQPPVASLGQPLGTRRGLETDFQRHHRGDLNWLTTQAGRRERLI